MKLQGKLGAVIVTALVATMLLLASIVFILQRQHSQLDLLGQMGLKLDQTQQQTQSFIDNTTANARLFSSSNLMERYVLVEDEADRYDLMQPALLRLFNKYQQAYPEYRELRLILPDGYEDTRIAQSGSINLTEEEYDTPYFQAMLRNVSSKSHTAILKNPDDNQTALLTSVPIFRRDPVTSGINAKPILRGFMVVTAGLDFLQNVIKSQRIGNSGYLVAVDRQRRIIFHPDDSMVGVDAMSLTKPAAASGESSTSSETIGGARLSKFQGESVYVRERWLHPDLLLLSVLPTSEFKAMSQRIAKPVAIVAIGAIATISFILFILLRKLVVSPVRQLRRLAIAVGEGRHVEVSDHKLRRDDEIGDLARSFRDMNNQLGHTMQELQQSHAKIEQLAYRDSLTGLPNRRLFLEMVGQAVSSSVRSNQCGAILFLDLDDFKAVNDTLGHEVGDVLLREVAQRLTACLRDTDVAMRDSGITDEDANDGIVARLGGDEFIILVSDLNEAFDAQVVAERILSAMRQPVLLQKQEFVVGVSIGIATYPDNSSEAEVLIKCADMAMYEAKRQDKNTYRFYDDDMQLEIQERLCLERDLRIAVIEKDFTLHFQPQFDTHTQQISGAEVLLRWYHVERGNVPPDCFIAVAEDIGLIGELGEWIIDETCRQWSVWNQLGIAPPRIAVNVSQKQFKHSNLVGVVNDSLIRHQMPSTALELEITESCIMEGPKEVVETLNVMRDEGVSISMDDFGTGYSSLGALISLPIDTLKIDRSFITGIEIGKPNDKIVSAIVSLAHNLNLEVVAEGVETSSEHQYLVNINCNICQGYLFSKPLPADAMTELLEQERNRVVEVSRKRAGYR